MKLMIAKTKICSLKTYAMVFAAKEKFNHISG